MISWWIWESICFIVDLLLRLWYEHLSLIDLLFCWNSQITWNLMRVFGYCLGYDYLRWNAHFAELIDHKWMEKRKKLLQNYEFVLTEEIFGGIFHICIVPILQSYPFQFYMNCWGLCLFCNTMFLRIQTRETITIFKRSRILCRIPSLIYAYSSD